MCHNFEVIVAIYFLFLFSNLFVPSWGGLTVWAFYSHLQLMYSGARVQISHFMTFESSYSIKNVLCLKGLNLGDGKYKAWNSLMLLLNFKIYDFIKYESCKFQKKNCNAIVHLPSCLQSMNNMHLGQAIAYCCYCALL